MSDYAGVTPIPDYLNISDWYELVDGDALPKGWLNISLAPKGNVDITLSEYVSRPKSEIRSYLQDGVRIFTRTPVPTAIKRIRAAETQQDELPAEPTPLPADLQELRDKLAGHTDPEAMSRRISAIELSLKKLNERLSALIDGL